MKQILQPNIHKNNKIIKFTSMKVIQRACINVIKYDQSNIVVRDDRQICSCVVAPLYKKNLMQQIKKKMSNKAD